ncbi:orotidine-5'-phosphate decarboxylase [Pseudonocardia sp. HH130630-07]|uniref:orotidine-5'-phosphate decarboxylase n=1 Tax=Pseudonocardia sp. HH130630-07 TaxID=1690815 RepID=UPI00081511E8|nr:orotidine-5'-phosphate decarboxylase [Pseudonocardia sp. HH130630-07]ANY09495.1 Orotidine 5'-phosphate decarboxylase [Pseudonocardia sp. HH130630-07]
MTDFGKRLVEAVATYGSLCVGIDPHPALLARWGLTDDADGLAGFADTCVAGLAGAVAVVKPQSAFFERHGAAGVAVLERLLDDLAETPTLSLLDAKRGDIGSTMDGYADAYLRVGAPLGADAVTLSPYLGFEALEPAFVAAGEAGRGVFVLARTSNPEGAPVQLATVPGGGTLAQSVVDAAAARNAGAGACGAETDPGGPQPCGDVGVVVGGTRDHGLDLSGLYGPVLVPGLGAQGASPADVVSRFAGTAGPVLPVAARSVLRAGPDAGALRDAARALGEELTSASAGSH